jgi:hypothetical protein
MSFVAQLKKGPKIEYREAGDCVFFSMSIEPLKIADFGLCLSYEGDSWQVTVRESQPFLMTYGIKFEEDERCKCSIQLCYEYNHLSCVFFNSWNVVQ